MFHTTDDTTLAGNPIDDVIGSSIKYAALVVAGKLGVLRALDGRPLTAAELATAIGASERGTTALADVLVTAGYLDLVDGRYQHGPVARRWLSADAPQDFTPALLWGYELWKVLWDLPQAVRDGKPAQSLWERWVDNPQAGKDFSDYMKVKSTLTVDSIVEAAPLPDGARRLLDLGGSHGLHSMAFCRRYPALHATIMDLPEALASTGDAIAAAGLADRISLRHGSFFEQEFGEGYDVVLLFEILHNHTPSENRALLAKAARALRPGGKVIILEDVKAEKLEEHNAAFSLAMFACSGDRTYGLDEFDAWLESAGFDRGELVPLPSSVSLVIGTRH
jgi:2-polyprenyl-3-methyl-5-hydroxy-6-metoxy-1,4-benzoquinol methylase